MLSVWIELGKTEIKMHCFYLYNSCIDCQKWLKVNSKIAMGIVMVTGYYITNLNLMLQIHTSDLLVADC